MMNAQWITEAVRTRAPTKMADTRARVAMATISMTTAKIVSVGSSEFNAFFIQ